MRPRRILAVLLVCAPLLGVSLCLFVYVAFYPIAFADGLFGSAPEVRSSSQWGPWRPISELGSPGAVSAQQGYTMYRIGQYHSVLHDFDVCEVMEPDGLCQKFIPGHTSSRVSVLRLAALTLCIAVVCTIGGMGMRVLKHRYGSSD